MWRSLNSFHSWDVHTFGILGGVGAVSIVVGRFFLFVDCKYGLVTLGGTYVDLEAEKDGMVSDGDDVLLFSLIFWLGDDRVF